MAEDSSMMYVQLSQRDLVCSSAQLTGITMFLFAPLDSIDPPIQEFRAHLGDRDGSEVLKLEEGDPSSSSRRKSKNYQDASEINYTPERALKAGLKMVKDVQRSLSKLTISSPLREEVWNKDIAEYVLLVRFPFDWR